MPCFLHFLKEINHFYVKDIFHLLQSIKYILPFHIELTIIIHRVSEKKTSGKLLINYVDLNMQKT